MLAIERHEAILRLLSESGSAMVSDLSEKLAVTEETIRRDLVKLETDNKLRRVHGGAYLPLHETGAVPASLRRRFFVGEKRRMAKACLPLIKEHDSIMLDSSTTALVLAQTLKEAKRNVTLITNSFDIIQTLGPCPFIQILALGGRFRNETSSFYGYLTLETLKQYHADFAFLSCACVHLDFGATDHIEGEALIRSTMLKQAKTTVLISDHTKLDRVATYKISPLEHAHYFITDKTLAPNWSDYFSNLSTQVIIADKE